MSTIERYLEKVVIYPTNYTALEAGAREALRQGLQHAEPLLNAFDKTNVTLRVLHPTDDLAFSGMWPRLDANFYSSDEAKSQAEQLRSLTQQTSRVSDLERLTQASLPAHYQAMLDARAAVETVSNGSLGVLTFMPASLINFNVNLVPLLKRHPATITIGDVSAAHMKFEGTPYYERFLQQIKELNVDLFKNHSMSQLSKALVSQFPGQSIIIPAYILAMNQRGDEAFFGSSLDVFQTKWLQGSLGGLYTENVNAVMIRYPPSESTQRRSMSTPGHEFGHAIFHHYISDLKAADRERHRQLIGEMNGLTPSNFDCPVLGGQSNQGTPPKKILLDLDSTDDPTHGAQQLSFYNGFYETHCYIPHYLYATVDDEPNNHLLAAVLRPGNTHSSHGALKLLKRVVKRLSKAFPGVEIEFRADAGFAVPEIYAWCEAENILYEIGLGKNNRLLKLGKSLMAEARKQYKETQEKIRLFGEFMYKADSWNKPRRVVMKAEILEKGENPRFVVTNRDLKPEALYERYVGRGDSENRIKEIKLDLKAGRTSCMRFMANQLRLILHAAAYVLFQTLKRLTQATELAAAQVETLRNRLLKLGALVKESVRRVWIRFSSYFPLQNLFVQVWNQLQQSSA